MNQWINQPINQTQSIAQSISQSINQPINESLERSITQSQQTLSTPWFKILFAGGAAAPTLSLHSTFQTQPKCCFFRCRKSQDVVIARPWVTKPVSSQQPEPSQQPAEVCNLYHAEARFSGTLRFHALPPGPSKSTLLQGCMEILAAQETIAFLLLSLKINLPSHKNN